MSGDPHQVPTLRPGQTIYSGPVELGSGQEWHSTAFIVPAGRVVKFDATGSDRFFAGFYSQLEYEAARKRSPAMFPFRLGSDEIGFHRAYNVTITSEYRIVLRVSGWRKAARIQLDVVCL